MGHSLVIHSFIHSFFNRRMKVTKTTIRHFTINTYRNEITSIVPNHFLRNMPVGRGKSWGCNRGFTICFFGKALERIQCTDLESTGRKEAGHGTCTFWIEEGRFHRKSWRIWKLRVGGDTGDTRKWRANWTLALNLARPCKFRIEDWRFWKNFFNPGNWIEDWRISGLDWKRFSRIFNFQSSIRTLQGLARYLFGCRVFNFSIVLICMR